MRLEFKPCFLVPGFKTIDIFGINVEIETIYDILYGNIFQGPVITTNSRNTWYPDDYIFIEGESCCVKEGDEALKVRSYMKGKDWLHHLETITGPTEHRVP